MIAGDRKSRSTEYCFLEYRILPASKHKPFQLQVFSIALTVGLCSTLSFAVKAQNATGDAGAKKIETPSVSTSSSVTQANDKKPIDSSEWSTKENEAETSFVNGAYTEAEKQWKEALAIAEKNSNKLNVAETLNQMTHLYIRQRRLDEARSSLQSALSIRQKELGDTSEKTAETLGNLALVEHKSGHDAEAEKLYKEVIDIKRKAGSQTSLAITLTNLGNLYGEMRRIEEAKQLYTEALNLDEKAFGKDHKEVAQDLFNLGALLYHHNYNKEAIEYFEKSLIVFTKINDTQGRIKSLHYLGLCHAEEKSHDKAIDYYKQALTLHSQLKGDKHPDTFVHQLNLARSLDETGKTQEAEDMYKDAVGAANSNHEDAKVKLVECTVEYVHFLRRHKRNAEAEKHLKQVLPTYESLSAHQRKQLYELPRVYSDLLKELKQDVAADAMARKHLDVFGATKPKSVQK